MKACIYDVNNLHYVVHRLDNDGMTVHRLDHDGMTTTKTTILRYSNTRQFPHTHVRSVVDEGGGVGASRGRSEAKT